jgi:uncharacterized membrane protein (DUF2068 family)
MLQSRLSKGLRLVAIFEAVKGTLVLALGFGLIAMAGKDIEVLAGRLVGFLHLGPAFSRIFLDLASHVDSTRLWMYTALAFVYAAVRFAEGYGLWYHRAWAEWFAALSAGLYIPIELMEVIRHTTWIKVIVLASNIAIVALLVKVLVESRKAKAQAKQVTAPPPPVPAE